MRCSGDDDVHLHPHHNDHNEYDDDDDDENRGALNTA